jgi:hypothetical protein
MVFLIRVGCRVSIAGKAMVRAAKHSNIKGGAGVHRWGQYLVAPRQTRFTLLSVSELG